MSLKLNRITNLKQRLTKALKPRIEAHTMNIEHSLLVNMIYVICSLDTETLNRNTLGPQNTSRNK